MTGWLRASWCNCYMLYPVRARPFLYLYTCLQYMRLWVASCWGSVHIGLINYDYACPHCPWSLWRFWPWFDHPRAQWVGGEPHVLDSSSRRVQDLPPQHRRAHRDSPVGHSTPTMHGSRYYRTGAAVLSLADGLQFPRCSQLQLQLQLHQQRLMLVRCGCCGGRRSHARCCWGALAPPRNSMLQAQAQAAPTATSTSTLPSESLRQTSAIVACLCSCSAKTRRIANTP